MSRELFVRLEESDVISRCQHEKVGISAIERLPGGGVRFVCMSSEGAGVMTRKLKQHLIEDTAIREKFRPRNPLW